MHSSYGSVPPRDEGLSFVMHEHEHESEAMAMGAAGDGSGRYTTAANTNTFWGKVFWSMLGIAAIALLATTSVIRSTNSDSHSAATLQTSLQHDGSGWDEASFTVYNSYGSAAPEYSSTWTHMAEPFRDTFLEIRDPQPNALYVWTVGNVIHTGSLVTHVFDKLGAQPVEVEIFVDNNLVGSHKGTVMVKYVRREIRSLTDEDRALTINAMYKIYTVEEEDGKALYGNDFKSIVYFVTKHLLGGADPSCDHWHDDAGVYTQHSAFSLEFEKAMQSIYPSVSLPYWDFALDVTNNALSSKSEIFQDDWFGELIPSNELHTISAGLWSTVRIKRHPAGGIQNGYGLLRSPWNQNPSPGITRYNKIVGDGWGADLPTCSEHYRLSHSDSLHQMFEHMNGASHGPVHVIVGGHWGLNSEVFDKMGFNAGSKYQILLMIKNLWRQGYVRCPNSCELEEKCVCSCPAHLYEGYTPFEVMKSKAKIMYWVEMFANNVNYVAGEDTYIINGYTQEEQQQMWNIFWGALCSAGTVGDMYTSGSPYDPTFWLIHPTVDRLVQFRRLYTDQYPLDETWYYENLPTASNTGLVCDWTGVDDTTMPVCRKGVCYGHAETDVTSFSDLSVTGRDGPYTNIELWDLLEPTNSELPYVYDTFKWDYCVAVGVDFEKWGPEDEDEAEESM